MDDSYFKDRLSAYFDKSLSAEDHAAVEQWLETSSEGQKLLEQYARLHEFSQEQIELGEAEDVWDQKAAKIEKALGFESSENSKTVEPVKKSGGSGWKILAAAASIAALTFIGLQSDKIFDSGSEDTLKPPTPESFEESSTPLLADSIDPKSDEEAAFRVTADEMLEPTPAAVQAIKLPELVTPSTVQSRKSKSLKKTEKSPNNRGSSSDIAAEGSSVGQLMDKIANGDTTSLTQARYDSENARAMAYGTILVNLGMDYEGKFDYVALQAARRESGLHKLLNAQYEIFTLSPDSAETATAQAFIEQVASDSTSSGQQLAQELLEKIKTDSSHIRD